MSLFIFHPKTMYGLKFISKLAELPYGSCLSAYTARTYGIPIETLRDVTKDLIRTGVIAPKQGRGGGYYLIADPDKVLLVDLINILEPKGVERDHWIIQKFYTVLMEFFSNYRITSLDSTCRIPRR